MKSLSYSKKNIENISYYSDIVDHNFITTDPSILKKEIKNIQKEGQFFSRVHVEDIAAIIKLSMQIRTDNNIYNIADDFPSSLSEVIQYICEQNQIPIPKKINYLDIDTNKRKESFFSDNKRVDNSRVKKDFSFIFKYPSFREGYEDL